MRKPPAPRKISPPDLPAQLETPLFPPAELTSDARVTDVALQDWDLSGQHAESATFDTVRVEGGNFSGLQAPRMRMRDVRVGKSACSNTRWSGLVADRAEFVDCRMTGLQASESKLQDVVFTRCKANLASFRYAGLRDVRFEDCQLVEADFLGADLRGVRFEGCDLTGANLQGAKLEGADLRGSRLDGLLVGPQDLKGVVIDAPQAIALSDTFARLLGLVVKDA